MHFVNEFVNIPLGQVPVNDTGLKEHKGQIKTMLVTCVTFHSPIGPYGGPVGQSPTAYRSRHESTAATRSSFFCG